MKMLTRAMAQLGGRNGHNAQSGRVARGEAFLQSAPLASIVPASSITGSPAEFLLAVGTGLGVLALNTYADRRMQFRRVVNSNQPLHVGHRHFHAGPLVQRKFAQLSPAQQHKLRMRPLECDFVDAIDPRNVAGLNAWAAIGNHDANFVIADANFYQWGVAQDVEAKDDALQCLTRVDPFDVIRHNNPQDCTKRLLQGVHYYLHYDAQHPGVARWMDAAIHHLWMHPPQTLLDPEDQFVYSALYVYDARKCPVGFRQYQKADAAISEFPTCIKQSDLATQVLDAAYGMLIDYEMHLTHGRRLPWGRMIPRAWEDYQNEHLSPAVFVQFLMCMAANKMIVGQSQLARSTLLAAHEVMQERELSTYASAYSMLYALHSPGREGSAELLQKSLQAFERTDDPQRVLWQLKLLESMQAKAATFSGPIAPERLVAVERLFHARLENHERLSEVWTMSHAKEPGA